MISRIKEINNEEDMMDTYEFYEEVRRKILEKKKSRDVSNWNHDINSMLVDSGNFQALFVEN